MQPTEPKAGRVIAIGDIHGCSIALATLVKAIAPTPSDRIIPLGDIIDYGPDSRGVIEQLIELKRQTQVILLTGNHEEMLLASLNDLFDVRSWRFHGGDITLESYDIENPSNIPFTHLDFLQLAKPYYETDDFAFVHAGYWPNQALPEMSSATLFWEFLEPKRVIPHFSGKTFIVGHTPQTSGKILDLGFVVCIDTDCSRGGWLTALDVTTGAYWQANELGMIREGNRNDSSSLSTSVP